MSTAAGKRKTNRHGESKTAPVLRVRILARSVFRRQDEFQEKVVVCHPGT
jgi:hypothetical protein